jgi:hypothetical protein
LINITFTDTIGVPDLYKPQPAFKVIPNWYKELPSYIGDEKKPNEIGSTTSTIKKCMPVFDAISSGYIIFSHTDIFVSIKDGEPWYAWPSFEPIQFHPIGQAPNHPAQNGFAYPKWINPWAIKTPPGYSCLFVQPFHRESTFTILPAVVDTDTYDSPVNFPFSLNMPISEEMIPAGTPIAQIIPFKRDSWEMVLGSEEELRNNFNTTKLLRSKFFDSYKTFFRQVKNYK